MNYEFIGRTVLKNDYDLSPILILPCSAWCTLQVENHQGRLIFGETGKSKKLLILTFSAF